MEVGDASSEDPGRSSPAVFGIGRVFDNLHAERKVDPRLRGDDGINF